jgi:hypothetical protein
MLQSTLLFIALVADVSAHNELSTQEVKEVAINVAKEAEFKHNKEIMELITMIDSTLPLTHLKKAAYNSDLKQALANYLLEV